MILGLSHVTLRSGALEEGIGELARLGYAVDFIQREIANPEGKRELQSRWTDRMNMSLCRAAAGLPIELVEYPWDFDGKDGAFFEPVAFVHRRELKAFKPGSLRPARDSEVAALEKVFRGSGPVALSHPYFKIPFWFFEAKDEAPAGVVGLVQRVSDFDGTCEFWTKRLTAKLELMSEQPGHRIAKVSCPSPLPAWKLTIVVVEEKAGASETKYPVPVETKMDSAGVTVISFVSSSLERDRQSVNPGEKSLTSRPFVIGVNGKDLRLELIQSLPGLYVELLEVKSVRG